jgi:hypothetical protein
MAIQPSVEPTHFMFSGKKKSLCKEPSRDEHDGMNMGLLHEVERFSIGSQATMVSNIYPIRDAPLDSNEFAVDDMMG